MSSRLVSLFTIILLTLQTSIALGHSLRYTIEGVHIWMPYESVLTLFEGAEPDEILELENYRFCRWGSTSIYFYKDGRVESVEGASFELDGEKRISVGDPLSKVIKIFGEPPIPEPNAASYSYGLTFKYDRMKKITRISILDEHPPTIPSHP